MLEVIFDHWWARGHFREGRELLGRVIARTGEQTLEHAVAVYGDALFARDLGDEQTSQRICRDAVQLFEALGNRTWLTAALVTLASVEALADFEAGKSLIDRAIAMAREDGDDFALGRAVGNLGWLTVMAGRHAEAVGPLEEAIDASARVGNVYGLAVDEGNLGMAALLLGDVDRAEALLQRSLPNISRLGMPWMLCAVLDELGIGVARERGDSARAVRLLGARDGLAATLGVAPEWFTDDEAVEALREALGSEAFGAAYAEGRAMIPEQIIDCAVGAERSAAGEP